MQIVTKWKVTSNLKRNFKKNTGLRQFQIAINYELIKEDWIESCNLHTLNQKIKN